MDEVALVKALDKETLDAYESKILSLCRLN
jgi:hypothetical protein